jgi:hypothetical protein
MLSAPSMADPNTCNDIARPLEMTTEEDRLDRLVSELSMIEFERP